MNFGIPPEEYEDDDFQKNEMPKGFPFMQAFKLTPKGPEPIELDYTLRMMNQKKLPICGLYDKEYVIYLINQIEIGNNLKILLECVPNPKFKGTRKVSMIDVYEYLDKTHFINLLIAKNFDQCIWYHEAIDIQMQILDSNDNESYSKILILVETNNCPESMLDTLAHDIYTNKSTSMNTSIPKIPIMSRVIKMNSYYAPVVCYNITFGFNMNSNVDFDDLSLSVLYDFILKEYIDDAIGYFYPEYHSNAQLDEFGDKLIRIQFSVKYDARLISIEMICSPAVFKMDSRTFVKYEYNNDNHAIGLTKLITENESDSLPSNNFVNFINSICSSEDTQVISLSTTAHGIISNIGEKYYIASASNAIFTPQRLIREKERFNKNDTKELENRIFTNLFEIPSGHEEVLNYWKSEKSILVNNLIIYGFINFNRPKCIMKTFADMYNILQKELYDIFGITKNDLSHNYVNTVICYDTDNICRIMLCTTKDSKEDKASSTANKKKFKLFGGGKK